MTAPRPQYMSALKIVCKRKSADDCARIAILQSYHYSVVKLFSKSSNQCDQGTYTLQTDRQTDDILWHHRAVKLGRQNVADIIGIADI